MVEDTPKKPLYRNRRDLLKTTGILTTGFVAGCTGSGPESTDTPTPTATSMGSGSTATLSKEDRYEQWRAETSEAAASELEGNEQLQFWTGVEGWEPMLQKDFSQINEHYAVLTDNINLTLGSGTQLEQRYARQFQANSVSVDYIDPPNLDKLFVTQGIETHDVSDVPNYIELADKFKLGNMFPAMASGFMPIYNTDRVSQPPESWDDFMAERFRGKEIAIDYTPSIPPVAKIFDVKGEQWLRELSTKQDPILINRLSDVFNAVVQGDAKLGVYDTTSHIGEAFIEDFPIDIVTNPETIAWAPQFDGVGMNPPHPNAAKLLVDMILSPEFQNTIFVENQVGKWSFGAETINPQELEKAWIDEVFYVTDLNRDINDMITTWQALIDAPV